MSTGPSVLSTFQFGLRGGQKDANLQLLVNSSLKFAIFWCSVRKKWGFWTLPEFQPLNRFPSFYVKMPTVLGLSPSRTPLLYVYVFLHKHVQFYIFRWSPLPGFSNYTNPTTYGTSTESFGRNESLFLKFEKLIICIYSSLKYRFCKNVTCSFSASPSYIQT